MDKSILLNAAEKAAEWIIGNQPADRLDANKGRSIYSYNSKTGYMILTTSWMTGGVCMALLAMYKRTGKQIYLDRAELAGRYIMSLQVMDQRNDRYYGGIRECTPQSMEFSPRDATTAAWALAWLYEATKNPEYLDRAILFGNWHMEHGMYDGWPLYDVLMDGQRGVYVKGSFQSGTGLFYHDLFMFSGDIRYIQRGLKPIAQQYHEFFNDDGSINVSRDVFGYQKRLKKKKNCIEADMHQYNDDFGNAMLQSAADLFGDESYRKTALKFAHWLADNQDEDGGFSNGRAPSAISMGLMYFHDLGNFYHDEKLLSARDKTLRKLLSIQFHDTGDARLDGGFQEAPDLGGGEAEYSVNMRTSMYALVALLKLESDVGDIWLGRHNAPFTDREDHPYVLKW
jgi:hypothetical protein